MNVHPATSGFSPELAKGSERTVEVLLKNDSQRIETALNLESSSARIEVQCLLQAVLQVNRAWLLTHSEQLLSDEQQAQFNILFERRLTGEPLAYLLGEREFYGLAFKVSPATLIPRPETELLVELALQRISQLPASPTHPDPPLSRREQGRSKNAFRVLDLGTGSGAIALSIAHVRRDVEVVAVDASAAALEVAQLNAQRLKLDNVRLVHSDWFDALHGERFDIIVSNPPYVAADDAHLKQGDLRFEPHTALVSGADGLDDIRRICAQAKAHLNNQGWLLFEHGYDQAEQVRALLQQSGFAGVFSARDLSGVERVSGGTNSKSLPK
ncbi:MAG: peptide chain release factor N(5)-glutamine methyltransferase [Gallionella sp.]